MNDDNDELLWQLRRLRTESAALRSSPDAREKLMRRFAEQQRWNRRTMLARAAWPVAIAAALLLSVGVIRNRPGASTEASAYTEAAEIVENDGFIAVPFVPPLAEGEATHVVHRELHPAELAGLGVNVDPASGLFMPADLLVGEDGFPRAVRVSNERISGEDAGGF